MPTNRFPGVGYRTNGKDWNFYERLSVVATTFGGDSTDGYQPDMFITFTTQGVMLTNEGTGVVEYSFNGNNLHGELDSTKVTNALTFDNRVVSKIWFRLKSGTAGPVTVSVAAWARL